MLTTTLMLMVTLFATIGLCGTRKGDKIDGKKEFEEHCAMCHPDGGNTGNPMKTLGRKTLKANGIKNSKQIIARMRNPGPGMTRFDEKAIPVKEAKAIAEYILKSFK